MQEVGVIKYLFLMSHESRVIIGVRAIFCQGGAVNHLPKKFLQVAQIFTKQSNRNEGHKMQQNRPY